KKTEYIGEFIYETDESGNTELQLIHHDEGRIVEDKTTGDFEYQYHLKDHLGNTRLTFTTKPKTLTFPATFESEKAADEEALYTSIAETRVTFNSADATASDIHTTGDNEVVRVNGTQPMGAGISLPVA
ncbi:hypothetical protein, partial [Fulvivirga imtechensis]|uniref:hypothetical protein n=1 Tax=Fulvivirga imtechensis TaxID=881893 RepID=UPI00058FC06A